MNTEVAVQPIAPITPDTMIMSAIEKGLDMNQLEKFLDLKERWDKQQAEKAFNFAMSAVQKEIGAVKATKNNAQTKSKYAGIVDIDAMVRPAYTSQGIALSFDTADSPLPEHVRILAFVTHESGHKETRHIDIPADGKGAKGGDVMTKTHAVMSATTYGQRALTKMIFNIASGEFDDDGNAASGGLSKEEMADAQKTIIVELLAEKGDKMHVDLKNRAEEIVRINDVKSFTKVIETLKKL
jgi:hypothetical protein